MFTPRYSGRIPPCILEHELMCGIAGFCGSVTADAERIVNQQLSCLLHRGSDATGFFRANGAVVGQTRLAIIDLVTGDPPIYNEDQSIGAALNGEIYNFREIRRDLEGRGHDFKTQVDTEVIAHLAEERDPADLASSLHGMFTFAVWDDRSQRLILGRDRLGKKPLYYWSDGRTFVFGSEIKALLVHPDVPDRLDETRIPAYLAFGYVPSPNTFFEGIRSVPPGHVLTVGQDGSIDIRSYWQPLLPGAHGVERSDLPLDQAAARVRALLTEAVERRLISDVPLGAFLSGGIDSSAVVGIMSTLVDQPVQTFTIGFDNQEGFDERPYARAIASRFNTDHHEFVVKPDAVELIEKLVWHHDQPFGDSSAIPTYLLAEVTGGHVKVALSGDGGDELFAGYERFAAALLLRRFQRLPGAVQRSLDRLVHIPPAHSFAGRAGSLQRFTSRMLQDVPDAFRQWVGYVPDDWIERLSGRLPDPLIEGYRQVWRSSDGGSLLDRLLYVNLKTYLLDDLLVKADRMSMAHALEVRSPFLDHELVEFALSLPDNARIKRLTLKRILKEAVSDLIPAELRNRRKRGFGVPLDRWFRTDLSGYLEARLLSLDSRIGEYISIDELKLLVGEHRTGIRNHGHALWTLLTLEVFLRSKS